MTPETPRISTTLNKICQSPDHEEGLVQLEHLSAYIKETTLERADF